MTPLSPEQTVYINEMIQQAAVNHPHLNIDLQPNIQAAVAAKMDRGLTFTVASQATLAEFIQLSPTSSTSKFNWKQATLVLLLLFLFAALGTKFLTKDTPAPQRANKDQIEQLKTPVPVSVTHTKKTIKADPISFPASYTRVTP